MRGAAGLPRLVGACPESFLFSMLKKHYDSRQAGMTTFYDFINSEILLFALRLKKKGLSTCSKDLLLRFISPAIQAAFIISGQNHLRCCLLPWRLTHPIF
jgi:hypothetical protein